MIWLVIILCIVAGALWRRWHGMGQGPRWLRLVVAFLLCWPIFLTWTEWWSGLLSLAITAYWVPGHDWTRWRALLVRYGPTPVALGYHWAHKKHSADPKYLQLNWLIDGPLAVAELNAGAWVYGAVSVALLI